MSRKKRKIGKRIEPDPKYNNVLVAKFINQVMRRGKKTVACEIVYSAFDLIKEKTKKNPIEVFDKAIKNASPILEVRGKRIGGASYQIPYEVRGDRRYALAFRWIIQAAKARHGRPMMEKLTEELLAAYQGEGSAIKKKEDMHRMAEANKAFAHFAV
jgi:small subunit ribosomal protein S7